MIKIEEVEETYDVYDITVEDNENFYANGILVHNCQEILLPTAPIKHIDSMCDGEEIALCVLSGINMGTVKIKELPQICDLLVRSLDYVIEKQDYPINASKHMLSRRSIGVGLTNLAYLLAKNKVRYEDPEALNIVDEFMEHMQFNLIQASVNLAKEKGPCKRLQETTYGKGILPIDTYNENVDKICNRKLECDWEGLREELKEHGIRNSTLTAIMPSESSSVVSNSTNGIEPPRSLISIKRSKRGNLVQVVPDIQKLKNHYTLAWEMYTNEGYINITAVIQKYVDQAISSNHYYNPMFFEDKEIPISCVMKDVMRSYWLGVKTLYYANTYDGKMDDDSGESGCSGGACTL